MKKFLSSLSVLALLCVTGVAIAGEYKFPEAGPLVSVTFPTGWNVEAEDDSLIALSTDETIEFDFWAVSQEEMKADAKATLEAMGQEIGDLVEEYLVDLNTEKPVTGTHNGLDVFAVEGAAKDRESGAPVNFSVSLLTPDNKNIFVLLYWGTDEAEKAHADELKGIAASLKKL